MNDLRKYVTLMENIVSGGDIIEDKTVSVTIPSGKSPEDTRIEDMKLSKFNTYIGATPENIRELIFNDLNEDGLALNENDWGYIDADKNEASQRDDFSIDIFMIRDGKVIPQAVNTTFEDFKNWEMTSDYPEDYFELVHKELSRTGNYINEEGWLNVEVIGHSELMNSEYYESINENSKVKVTNKSTGKSVVTTPKRINEKKHKANNTGSMENMIKELKENKKLENDIYKVELH